MKFGAFLATALVAAAITTAGAFGSAGGNSMPVIDVTTDGSSISVNGNTVSGAVDVHTVATGNSGAPVFVRLNDGVSADQLVTLVHSKSLNDPNQVSPYGSIVFDAGLGPGTHDVDTVLQPGEYVAFDSVAQKPSDWPYTTFTIGENKSPYQLPAAQQWQKSVEFRFRGPSTLHIGQTIRVANAGWVIHMMGAIRAQDEASAREIGHDLRTGQDNKAIKLARGFMDLFGPLSHGAVQQFTLTAAPGWYVMACFMDTQDGREHTKLGMVKLIHVVK